MLSLSESIIEMKRKIESTNSYLKKIIFMLERKLVMGSISRLIILLLLLSVCIKVHAQERPNIVLILTDDQSYGMLGATGNEVVDTPNIDKLANQGVLFTKAHVTSAICTPSRVSLLLGQYERKHGVNFNSGTAVSEEAWQQSYPVKFKEAGYYTGWVGKNHAPIGPLGYKSGIMEKSFDYWYAGHGHIFFYPKDKHAIFSEAQADTQAEIISAGVSDFLDTNEHKFDKALTFLDKRPADKPFMLSINFNLPHDAGVGNMQMRGSDDDLYKTAYRDRDIPLPKYYLAKANIRSPKLPEHLLRVEDRQDSYDYVDEPATLKERYIRQFQAMTGIDRLVGSLRDTLEKQGVADNTIIIFTSDHGLFMGEFGLGGKSLCYEKNTHVPLIIYDPRKNVRGKSDALVQSIDLAPTMLSLAGLTPPSSMQGEDITDVLYRQQAPQRKYALSENLWSTHFGNPRCEAIQDKNWKYIRYYKNENLSAQHKINVAKELNIPVNKMLYGFHDSDVAQYRHYMDAPLKGEPAVYEELYNLAEDPAETTNLVSSAKYNKKLKQLRKAWWPLLVKARGEGAPKVERYTIDLQLEMSENVKLE